MKTKTGSVNLPVFFVTKNTEDTDSLYAKQKGVGHRLRRTRNREFPQYGLRPQVLAAMACHVRQQIAQTQRSGCTWRSECPG